MNEPFEEGDISIVDINEDLKDSDIIGRTATISGWGYDEHGNGSTNYGRHLKQAEMTIVKQEENDPMYIGLLNDEGKSAGSQDSGGKLFILIVFAQMSQNYDPLNLLIPNHIIICRPCDNIRKWEEPVSWRCFLLFAYGIVELLQFQRTSYVFKCLLSAQVDQKAYR